MLRFLFLLAVALTALRVSAADVQVIYSARIDNLHVSRHVDAILDSDKEIEGFVVSDSSRLLRLIWLDGRPEDSIVLTAWPHKTVNFRNEDSLYIYGFFERNDHVDYNGTYPELTRLTVTDELAERRTVVPQLYWGVNAMDYMGCIPLYENLRLDLNSSGEVRAVVFEDRIDWYGYIFTIGSTRGIVGTSVSYSPDLSTILHRSSNEFLRPGYFTNDTILEYFRGSLTYYYQDAWDDWSPPSEWTAVKVSLGNALGAQRTLYHKGSTDLTQIIAGDFTDQFPYDEVLLCSKTGLVDTGTIEAKNLSCYQLANGVPELMWSTLQSGDFQRWGIYPELYFAPRKAVIGTLRSTVHFLNARTGEFADSVNVGRPIRNYEYFVTGQSGSDLNLLIRSNDTLIVYRFDAITDVSDSESIVPSDFTLSQNYPNPFNATTEIRFSLARASNVVLTVYNLIGQEVRTLVVGKVTAGEHRVTWDGKDNSSTTCATGVYLYRLQTDETSQSRKMLLLK